MTERTSPASRSTWTPDGPGGAGGRAGPPRNGVGAAGRRGRTDRRRGARRGAGDRLHLRRAAHRRRSWVGRSMRSSRRTSRSATCDGHRRGSTPAMRRGTGSTATPSGTGRAARFASARRSGCGSRSTPPRWRGPGRPSSAGTTSAPSGRRTARRSGPSWRSGSGGQGRLVTIDVRADAFLRGMVRRMVAVLLEVGRGKMDEAAVRAALAGPGTGPRRGSRPGQGALPPARRPRATDGRTERRTRGTMNAKTYSGPRERDRATLVRRRRDRRDAGPPRVADRARPRGQAQADLPAEPRLGRPRHRAQRGADRA